MKSCREYPRLFIRMESTARRLQSSAVLENRDANIDYNRSRPPMTLERTIEYQRVTRAFFFSVENNTRDPSSAREITYTLCIHFCLRERKERSNKRRHRLGLDVIACEIWRIISLARLQNGSDNNAFGK